MATTTFVWLGMGAWCVASRWSPDATAERVLRLPHSGGPPTAVHFARLCPADRSLLTLGPLDWAWYSRVQRGPVPSPHSGPRPDSWLIDPECPMVLVPAETPPPLGVERGIGPLSWTSLDAVLSGGWEGTPSPPASPQGGWKPLAPLIPRGRAPWRSDPAVREGGEQPAPPLPGSHRLATEGLTVVPRAAFLLWLMHCLDRMEPGATAAPSTRSPWWSCRGRCERLLWCSQGDPPIGSRESRHRRREEALTQYAIHTSCDLEGRQRATPALRCAADTLHWTAAVSAIVRELVTEVAGLLQLAGHPGGAFDLDGWLYLSAGTTPTHPVDGGPLETMMRQERRHREAWVRTQAAVARALCAGRDCRQALGVLWSQQQAVWQRRRPGCDVLHDQAVVEKTVHWALACLGCVERLLWAVLSPPSASSAGSWLTTHRAWAALWFRVLSEWCQR